MTKTGRHLLWGGIALGAVTLSVVVLCAMTAFQEMQSCKQDTGRKAVESCTKIIRHHGAAAWAYAKRGAAYFKLHDTNNALRDLDEAVRLDPTADHLALRCHVLVVSGRHVENTNCNAAAKLDPRRDLSFGRSAFLGRKYR